MKKKIIFSLLTLAMVFSMTGCFKTKKVTNNNSSNSNVPSQSEIKKVTTDAPMTDIEKEVLKGEGGIQNEYSVENIRIENGNIIGTVTNKGSAQKSISISILMMSVETGGQFGIIDVEVNELGAGETREFINPVNESAWAANNFEPRVYER